jgi:hypothetical protein
LEKRIYQEAEMNYCMLKDRLIKKLLEIKRLYMRDKGLFQIQERSFEENNPKSDFEKPNINSNPNIFKEVEPKKDPNTPKNLQAIPDSQKIKENEIKKNDQSKVVKVGLFNKFKINLSQT